MLFYLGVPHITEMPWMKGLFTPLPPHPIIKIKTSSINDSLVSWTVGRRAGKKLPPSLNAMPDVTIVAPYRRQHVTAIPLKSIFFR